MQGNCPHMEIEGGEEIFLCMTGMVGICIKNILKDFILFG